MNNIGENDGFFKIDPECHLIGDMEAINHFPGVKMWWRAIDGTMRPLMQGAPAHYLETMESWEMEKTNDPEQIIRSMDKYGVDVACLLPESMMDTTGYSSRWCTNGDTWKVVEKYPERFIMQPNLSPIKHRGIGHVIQEMEYWVAKGVKLFKYYPPEDTFINDPELWPFYRRAEELGIVLDIHTGFSWVPPGKSKYCLPVQLDDVARDFPNLTLVAFHMGYPYCDDLNMVAMGHPNVYLCLSLLVPWAISAPYKFAKILGEAMRFAGPDRIIWGTDSAGFGAQIGAAVLGLRDFQMPEELQWQYGYVPLRDEDKGKMFGGNLARLLGIDTAVRRVGGGTSASVEPAMTVAVPGTGPAGDLHFDIKVKTPIGDFPGTLDLQVAGESAAGALAVKDSVSRFSGGSLVGGKLAFAGHLKTPFGASDYTLEGTITNGKINAMIKTKAGNLSVASR